jgi:hypothetical protein
MISALIIPDDRRSALPCEISYGDAMMAVVLRIFLRGHEFVQPDLLAGVGMHREDTLS